MNAPLLAATLIRADRVRSFHVRPASPAGWEAFEREDQRITHQQRHTDWHRVELTLDRFAREIAELKKQGWLET
jgi:hypothetical protein